MIPTWLARYAGALGVIAYALVVLGVSVHLFLLPAYTRALVAALDVPAGAGLPEAQALALAEEVRAYVAWPSGTTLPERLPDGRTAFSPAAVAHLDDVRNVLSGSRVALLLAAGFALVWSAWAWRGDRARRRLLAGSLRAAVWMLVAMVVGAVLGLLFAFDAVFVGFHALFFEGDTWLFPNDELLILLFPEPFWAASGIAWGVLALLGAGLLKLGAHKVAEGSSADGE